MVGELRYTLTRGGTGKVTIDETDPTPTVPLSMPLALPLPLPLPVP